MSNVRREPPLNTVDLKDGTPYPMTRDWVLRKAMHLTMGDRNDAYGDPFTNMHQTAEAIKAATGYAVTPSDVCLIMVSVKLARLRQSPGHTDSVVDAAAYLAMYAEVHQTEERLRAQQTEPGTAFASGPGGPTAVHRG